MNRTRQVIAGVGLSVALLAGGAASAEVQPAGAEVAAATAANRLKFHNYNPAVVKLARGIIARSVTPPHNVPSGTNGYTTFNRYGDVIDYTMHSTRGIHNARGVDLLGIHAITGGGRSTLDLELARSPKTGRWNTFCSDTAQYGTSIASEIEQTYDSSDSFPNVVASQLMLKEAIREDGHFIADRGNAPAGVLPYAGWQVSTTTCDALSGAAGEGNYTRIIEGATGAGNYIVALESTTGVGFYTDPIAA